MSGFPVYASDPSTVREHPAGRYRFAPGKRCNRLAPLDGNGLAARLSQDEDEACARAHGARLATHEEALAIAKQAHFITPVIIRETPEERAERERRGGQDALERMATRAWCERADAGVKAELAATDWGGDLPVYNDGKHWDQRIAAQVAASVAVNEGWQTSPGSVAEIQTPGTRHDAGGENGIQQGARGQRDFSQVGLWVWDEDLPSDPPWRPSLLERAFAYAADFFMRL